jgi:hypothetical protein
LVRVQLPLLLVLLLILSHQLIADQGSDDQPDGSAYGGSYRRVTHGAADDRPRARAHEDP